MRAAALAAAAIFAGLEEGPPLPDAQRPAQRSSAEVQAERIRLANLKRARKAQRLLAAKAKGGIG